MENDPQTKRLDFLGRNEPATILPRTLLNPGLEYQVLLLPVLYSENDQQLYIAENPRGKDDISDMSFFKSLNQTFSIASNTISEKLEPVTKELKKKFDPLKEKFAPYNERVYTSTISVAEKVQPYFDKGLKATTDYIGNAWNSAVRFVEGGFGDENSYNNVVLEVATDYYPEGENVNETDTIISNTMTLDNANITSAEIGATVADEKANENEANH